jgi:hypothetical protein
MASHVCSRKNGTVDIGRAKKTAKYLDKIQEMLHSTHPSHSSVKSETHFYAPKLEPHLK